MLFKYSRLAAMLLILALACTEETPAPQTEVRITAFETTIDENPSNGQSVGTIEVSGAEGPLNFTLGNQAPAGALSIAPGSGELFVNNADIFNFEVNTQVSALVTVTAQNGTATGAVVVNIRNVDESDLFTVWTGPQITFVKADGADPAVEANQDRITDNVWITRGNDGGQIYNARNETTANSDTSPAGTKWAVGQVAEIEALTFTDFRTAVDKPKDVVGKDLVMYLEGEEVYLAVTVNAWSTGKAGGFTYTRATQN